MGENNNEGITTEAHQLTNRRDLNNNSNKNKSNSNRTGNSSWDKMFEKYKMKVSQESMTKKRSLFNQQQNKSKLRDILL